jgi:hypothetical protein
MPLIKEKMGILPPKKQENIDLTPILPYKGRLSEAL